MCISWPSSSTHAGWAQSSKKSLTAPSLVADLDADSQTEAPNAVMSGPESDSESEPAQDDDNAEQCGANDETKYMPSDEEEFGEVS